MFESHPVIDYTGELEGTHFQFFALLQCRGKEGWGIKPYESPTNKKFGLLWNATLSQYARHEKDQAFTCVYLDEYNVIDKKEYMKYLKEGFYRDC